MGAQSSLNKGGPPGSLDDPGGPLSPNVRRSYLPLPDLVGIGVSLSACWASTLPDAS
ncbi:hypothetical protein ABIA35_008783 [Catenulispora sp. MAP12-49]